MVKIRILASGIDLCSCLVTSKPLIGDIEMSVMMTSGRRSRASATVWSPSPASPQTSYSLLDALTSREREVLALIGQGKTNAEIAAVLFVSDGTVKTHINHLFTKLQLRDRAAAVVFAFDHDFVTPAQDGPSD